MVVVAIIGLLSAVAIPNFKKYQAKSKMSEAKLQLSSIYTAETSFYSDFNIYAQCLPYMGYDPSAEIASRYYAMGFVKAEKIEGSAPVGTTPGDGAYGAAVTSGLAPGDCPIGNDGGNGTTDGKPAEPSARFFAAGKGIGSSKAIDASYLSDKTTSGTQATRDDMTFLAGAGGVISVDNPDFGTATKNSQLTINEKKIIAILRNGF